MPRLRRKPALAFAAAAVALIAASIVSAADAGYRFVDGKVMLPQRHQGHIYLHAFGDPPELVILVALAMLGVAAYLGIVRAQHHLVQALSITQGRHTESLRQLGETVEKVRRTRMRKRSSLSS
jgi:hypothetical protein